MVVCFSMLAILLSACLGEKKEGFAIYLVPGISNPQQVDLANLSKDQLSESPIISEDDILSYDQATHQIGLTEEGIKKVGDLFSLPVDVDGMPFVVTVAGVPIYSGAFYTPLSSLSYTGVVILQPIDPNLRSINISLGYPGPDAFIGDDPRSDQRIINRLDAANKLK